MLSPVTPIALSTERRTLTERRAHLDALYYAAETADRAFGDALRRAYGSKAPDMRYQTSRQSAAVQAFGAAYVEAIDAWRAAYRLTVAGRIYDANTPR
jgi:hypothetical protein